MNTGLDDTEIVEVPEYAMFDPKVKCVTGELKKLLHSVVEEVRGTE
jgi:hypothetical protein